MSWQFLSDDDRRTLTSALAKHSLITAGSTDRVVLLSQAGLSDYTAVLGALANSAARTFAGELVLVLEDGGWQADPPRQTLAALLDYLDAVGDTPMSTRELFGLITDTYELRDPNGCWRREGREVDLKPDLLTLSQVVTLVVALKNADQPTIWDGRTPYLGLNAFQESDAAFFFGREELVTELLTRVERADFVTIAGPSGSGKSSLARAGLFHALDEGKLPRSKTWLRATMLPGSDPLLQLSRAFDRLGGRGFAAELRESVDEPLDPLLLHELAETLLTDDKRQRLVLLVDQFEELFTQTADPTARDRFIRLLTTAAQQPNGRVKVVISLRSDFVSNVAAYDDLRQLLSQEFQLVGAMRPRDLAKAITLPSLEVGSKIEPALVKQIIDDMKGEPGALPLMSFALQDLFEQEKPDDGPGHEMDLTLDEYVSRGGLESALERHAKEVFAGFSEEQEALARSIFSKLITVGEGRLDTRRTASFTELIPASADAALMAQTVTALSDENARLLTVRGIEAVDEKADLSAADVSVTIAHEKLIDAWPWLRDLVNENREAIKLQNEIAEAARIWEKEGFEKGYLYSGGQLASAEERLENADVQLAALSERFIKESVAQKKRSKRNLMLMMAALGVLALAASAAAILAFMQRSEAQTREREALSRQFAAQAETHASSNLGLALLLAAQANDLAETSESKGIVIDLINGAPSRILGRVGNDVQLAPEQVDLAFSPDSSQLTVTCSVNPLYIPIEPYFGNCSSANSLEDVIVQARLNTENGAVVDVRSFTTTLGSTNAFDARPRGGNVSPDGRLMVVITEGNDLRLWDYVADEYLPSIKLPYHEEQWYYADPSFSADGSRIAIERNGSIEVWEIDTGDRLFYYPLRSSQSYPPSALDVALNHDGTMLALGTYRPELDALNIWMVGNRTTIPEVQHYWQRPSGRREYYARSPIFAETPHRSMLYFGEAVLEKDSNSDWFRTESVLDFLWYVPATVGYEGEYPTDIVFDEDGSHLVVALRDGRIIVGNLQQIRSSRSGSITSGWKTIVNMPEDRALKMAVSHDNRFLATIHSSGWVYLWDLEGHVGEDQGGRMNPNDFQMNYLAPGGQQLSILRTQNELTITDSSRSIVSQFPVDSSERPVDFNFSVDATRLIFLVPPDRISVWNPPDNSPNQSIVSSDSSTEWLDVTLSADGRVLAALDKGGDVTFWKESEVGLYEQYLKHNFGPQNPRAIALNHDGSYLALADPSPITSIKVWIPDSLEFSNTELRYQSESTNVGLILVDLVFHPELTDSLYVLSCYARVADNGLCEGTLWNIGSPVPVAELFTDIPFLWNTTVDGRRYERRDGLHSFSPDGSEAWFLQRKSSQQNSLEWDGTHDWLPDLDAYLIAWQLDSKTLVEMACFIIYNGNVVSQSDFSQYIVSLLDANEWVCRNGSVDPVTE